MRNSINIKEVKKWAFLMVKMVGLKKLKNL
jgi:hypothetical protein